MELEGEGVDCDRCIDESVIVWGDKLCQTGGAGRRHAWMMHAQESSSPEAHALPGLLLLQPPSLACL